MKLLDIGVDTQITLRQVFAHFKLGIYIHSVDNFLQHKTIG